MTRNNAPAPSASDDVMIGVLTQRIRDRWKNRWIDWAIVAYTRAAPITLVRGRSERSRQEPACAAGWMGYVSGSSTGPAPGSSRPASTAVPSGEGCLAGRLDRAAGGQMQHLPSHRQCPGHHAWTGWKPDPSETCTARCGLPMPGAHSLDGDGIGGARAARGCGAGSSGHRNTPVTPDPPAGPCKRRAKRRARRERATGEQGPRFTRMRAIARRSGRPLRITNRLLERRPDRLATRVAG